MELEEMQKLWSEMSSKIENQKKLTDKLILDMTQEKYTKQIRFISIPEIVGTIICFGMAIFLITNMSKLDTWYLSMVGVLCILFLIVLPILSLRSIYRMQQINVSENDYKNTLQKFTKRKRHFWFVQRVGFYFSFLFMFMILPLLIKIMKNSDLFTSSKTWIWFVPFGVVFLLFFARWVHQHYKKATTKAEHLLKELED